jgi:predicted dienelactone hydrolase
MLACDGAGAVDFQEAVAPDPDDRPLQIGIWHPSGIAATRLPLVVLSHGTGGTFLDQRPTALALAEAGFIAVGALHTGDNYRDRSYVAKGTHLVGRPRHVARVIDYMLSSWSQRERIDPARIGIFGFSAGGFTALVVIGGQPDLSAAAGFCEQHPEDGDCALMRRNDLAKRWQEQSPKNDWAHDPRVRAAVVVAPAAGYVFAPHGLSKVRVPVQLWAGARDRVVDTATKTAVVRRLLPQPPEYHEIEGATHFAFIGPCPPALLAIMTERSGTGEDNPCLDPPGFDRAAFHASFNREVVRFLSEKLAPPPH